MPPLKKQTALNYGFSIIEVLVGLAIAGMAAFVLIKSSDSLQSIMRFSKTVPAATRYAEQLLAGARAMLLDIGPDGSADQGICSLVSTDAAAPGVGNILITIAPYGGRSRYTFSDSRWRDKFGGWSAIGSRPEAGCTYSDNWRRCFSLAGNNRAELSNQGLVDMDLVGSIQIIPTYTNPNKGLFSRINVGEADRSFDVKDVGFSIVAEVSYKATAKSTKRTVKKLSDFVWAPSAGLCKGRLTPNGGTRGSQVLLSLSGMGASNPDGSTVYNRSYFTGELDAPMIVDFRKTQIQEGKLADNGQAITTDTSKNIAVSCNERRYRCPLLASNERTYGPMNVTMDLEYNPRNTLAKFAASMTLKPAFSITRSGSEAVTSSSKQTYTLDGVSGSSFRVTGSHQLAAQITDRESTDSANNVCRAICVEKTNYNKGGDNSASRFRPNLKYSFQEFPQNGFSAPSDEEVGCTACYMKNCAQIGLGTFGPMDKQPDQPLDSNIPECWLVEPPGNRQPYLDTTTFTLEGFNEGDKQCIAGRLDPASNKLILRPKSCDSQLATLCYGFGGFVLPRQINGTNWTPIRGSQIEAPKTCYQMGTETANGSSLAAILEAADAANLPSQSGEITMMNLAQQGMFLAPQLPKDLIGLRKWMTKYGIDEEFWIALNYKQGKVTAIAPPVVNTSGKDNLALYYNTSGRMRLTKYALNLSDYGPTGQAESGAGRLLFHHLMFKGEVAVTASQGRSYRFICVGDKENIFVSAKRGSSYGQGSDICQAEGGAFYRPETPREWIEALNSSQPLMDLLPYPNVDLNKSDKLDPVWIATDYAPTSGNGGAVKSGRLQ